MRDERAQGGDARIGPHGAPRSGRAFRPHPYGCGAGDTSPASVASAVSKRVPSLLAT